VRGSVGGIGGEIENFEEIWKFPDVKNYVRYDW
jgi:hypothetical protein